MATASPDINVTISNATGQTTIQTVMAISVMQTGIPGGWTQSLSRGELDRADRNQRHP